MKVTFKYGTSDKLPSTPTPGQLTVTTDEKAIYFDVDSNTRIPLNDIIKLKVAHDNVTTVTNPILGKLYLTTDNYLLKPRYLASTETWTWELVSVGTHTATADDPGLVRSTTTGTVKNRDYYVEVTKNGSMKVNVPWTDATDFIPTSDKGNPNGVATLDANGLITSTQLPSYVDDVIDGYVKSDDSTNFYKTRTGDSGAYAYTEPYVLSQGKIYVDVDSKLTYRYTGTTLVEISKSLALGETASTAYRGDYGKIAYEHSRATHAPSDATKVEASASNGYIKINGIDKKVYTLPKASLVSEEKRIGGVYVTPRMNIPNDYDECLMDMCSGQVYAPTLLWDTLT